MLGFLRGRLLDKVAMSYVQALRPSSVRIVGMGLTVNADSKCWRVTICTFKRRGKRHIVSIHQEVEVGLPNGVAHGEALKWACQYGLNSPEASWWRDETALHVQGDRMFKKTEKRGLVEWKLKKRDRPRSVWAVCH